MTGRPEMPHVATAAVPSSAARRCASLRTATAAARSKWLYTPPGVVATTTAARSRSSSTAARTCPTARAASSDRSLDASAGVRMASLPCTKHWTQRKGTSRPRARHTALWHACNASRACSVLRVVDTFPPAGPATITQPQCEAACTGKHVSMRPPHTVPCLHKHTSGVAMPATHRTAPALDCAVRRAPAPASPPAPPAVAAGLSGEGYRARSHKS